MRNQLQHALCAVALVAGLTATAAAAAAAPGDPVSNTEQVQDFALTGAESWSDLQGRAILVEFFAYW
jgi:hypothetical protein